MPKSADVADFAAKLDLLTKRLNWSRSRLAQAVGVDKSLIARWSKGASRPTENSLMQLTAAAAKLVDGFTAADWDLAPADFAKRLGLDGVSIAAAPVMGGNGGLADMAFPLAFRDFTLNFARYAGIYAGFYRRYMYSAHADGSLIVRALRIWPEAGVLRYETQGPDSPTEGICICTIKNLDLPRSIGVPRRHYLWHRQWNSDTATPPAFRDICHAPPVERKIRRRELGRAPIRRTATRDARSDTAAMARVDIGKSAI
jgi:transcriptional regulator with XRE-family HTH domain